MSIIKAIKRRIGLIYLKLFPTYRKELKKAIGDSKTLLDVGCGSDSPIRAFSSAFYSVGVDTFAPSIKRSKKLKIHDKYYKMKVLSLANRFKANSFDCVLASDLIEHLTKEEGFELIKIMEKIAKKKVIIFTPNGFLHQGEYDNNPFQVHKSGWTVDEMRKRGYEVIGINGIKQLRGEYSKIKYKPTFFFLTLSNITQFFVRNRPKLAFQILCVKNKKQKTT